MILVLCLGNAIRSDDAVALRAADLLERDPPPGAVVRRSAASGLYLVDEMEGFERVVVLDAVRTGGHAPGTVHSFRLEELRTPAGPSPHSIGLPSALARVRAAGVPVPALVHVVAVEVVDLETVGERLTPPVERAVPAAADAVRRAVAALVRQGQGPLGGVHDAWRVPGRRPIYDAAMPGDARGERIRARTVADCVDLPRHSGSLAGAARVGQAEADGRLVRIGVWRERGGLRARYRASVCAALIAYAEVACEALETGVPPTALDAAALRARVSGVHPIHHERAALVAAALRDAFHEELA